MAMMRKCPKRWGQIQFKSNSVDFVSTQAELQGPGGIQSRGYFLYRVYGHVYQRIYSLTSYVEC